MYKTKNGYEVNIKLFFQELLTIIFKIDTMYSWIFIFINYPKPVCANFPHNFQITSFSRIGTIYFIIIMFIHPLGIISNFIRNLCGKIPLFPSTEQIYHHTISDITSNIMFLHKILSLSDNWNWVKLNFKIAYKNQTPLTITLHVQEHV